MNVCPDGRRRRIDVTINPSTLSCLDSAAFELKTSRSRLIEHAVEFWYSHYASRDELKVVHDA